MLAKQIEEPVLVERLEQSHGHHVRVAPGRERLGLVQHVGHAVRHPRGEVTPHRPEHDHDARRHVLATVGAGAFDHGDRSGVTHGESVSRTPGGEKPPGGRPVQRRVAQQHVLIRAAGGCRLAERADHDLAAGEPLTDVVVCVTLELEVHPREGEGAEALPRAAAEPQAD